MHKYVSNKGGGLPVDLETAILDGFAADGGLYVPQDLPSVSHQQLEQWSNLSYSDLAFEILSLFINRNIISEEELRKIIKTAYGHFEKEEVIPMHKLSSRKDTYIMELFYGPTLSFKDIGLAFLVTLINFFLERKKEKRTLIVATTGDTGPATAFFAAGKPTLDAWVLYPTSMITLEQEQQMTSLPFHNIHPVSVDNCSDGADDLDLAISELFANLEFKKKVGLSSVNSINWGRIMMQTVHYFYGYLQVVENIGEPINMSVPSGAFGNLCAGSIARKMGLPIETFVCANNQNACLHRIFTDGVFSKKDIHQTVSLAMDILLPYNFWRWLYFVTDKNTERINSWQEEFAKNGSFSFDADTLTKIKKGVLSYSVTDEETLDLIKDVYSEEDYLLDPHGAVALFASDALADKLSENKLICLSTAHPAKFPEIITRAIGGNSLPEAATHPSIEAAKKSLQKVYTCDHHNLAEALRQAVETNWELTNSAQ